MSGNIIEQYGLILSKGFGKLDGHIMNFAEWLGKVNPSKNFIHNPEQYTNKFFEGFNATANQSAKDGLHQFASHVGDTFTNAASHAHFNPLLAGTLAAVGIGAAAIGGVALANNANKTSAVKTVATELAEDAMRSKPVVDAVKAPVVMSTLKSAAMKI